MILPALLSLAMTPADLPRSKARGFAPGAVRLLPSAFSRARDANVAYLLSLEPERFLHNFRKNAGLEPKGKIYGGWESQGVAGQSLGHYLSALGREFAATRDKRIGAKLTETIDGLAECQAQRPDGYVGGIPDGERIWGEIRRGEVRSQGFDLNGGWVPWYTLHKLYAGLLDAHTLAANPKALGIARKMGDWAVGVTANLDDAKWQTMLACEHGGMNESLAELSALTGEVKYLALARKFDHKAVLDPLREGKDDLAGKHANTQVPKLVGLARLYEIEGKATDRRAAEFFWERVVNHHTYAIGGNSDHEHFGAPDKLSGRLSGNSAETCNTYNMLKLTQRLWAWEPDARRMDFYERALFNHILGAQDPATGMFVYYHPLDAGGAREFSTPFDSFWCCVGTGMENPTRYGDAAYAHEGARTLWVNLFLPSELEWVEAGVRLRQETRLPEEGRTTFTIVKAVAKGATTFDLALRSPAWSKDAKVRLNGRTIRTSKAGDGYLHLRRVWRTGDRVEFETPMALRAEPMPDKSDRVAIIYGPTMLAADLAPKEVPRGLPPALVTDGRPVADWLRPVKGKPLTFATKSGVGQPETITFRPYAEARHRRQAVYLDLYDRAAWNREADARAEAERARREIEANTVDVLRIGEMQPERDHELIGERTETGAFGDRNWRHALDGGWFSFVLKTDPAVPNALVLTLWGGDGEGREFDVMVDGETIATERMARRDPPAFYDRIVPIPARLAGAGKVTVRLQAKPGRIAGGIFGARTIRTKSP